MECFGYIIDDGLCLWSKTNLLCKLWGARALLCWHGIKWNCFYLSHFHKKWLSLLVFFFIITVFIVIFVTGWCIPAGPSFPFIVQPSCKQQLQVIFTLCWLRNHAFSIIRGLSSKFKLACDEASWCSIQGFCMTCPPPMSFAQWIPCSLEHLKLHCHDANHMD